MKAGVLLITAVTFAGFAIWFLLRPADLLTSFGIEQQTPAVLVEIRAFYGGAEMGVALAMGLLCWRRKLTEGCIVGGALLTCMGGVRLLSMLGSEFVMLHAVLAAAELIGAALCWWASRLEPTA